MRPRPAWLATTSRARPGRHVRSAQAAAGSGWQMRAAMARWRADAAATRVAHPREAPRPRRGRDTDRRRRARGCAAAAAPSARAAPTCAPRTAAQRHSGDDRASTRARAQWAVPSVLRDYSAQHYQYFPSAASARAHTSAPSLSLSVETPPPPPPPPRPCAARAAWPVAPPLDRPSARAGAACVCRLRAVPRRGAASDGGEFCRGGSGPHVDGVSPVPALMWQG